MIADFLKAPLSRLVIFLCVTTLLACPGALMLWMTERDQFDKFNSFQLVVLSVGLVLPFIVFNSAVVAWSFSLHRWINRAVRHKKVLRHREAVVAASSVFAGAIGAMVPAYAPILAHLLGYAHGHQELALVALRSEALPLVFLLLIDPSNYWRGVDEQADDDDQTARKLDIAVELHVHREKKQSTAQAPEK
jgi:hypothetical protein